jgi:hypothetical protein
MLSYDAPTTEFRFLLEEVFDYEHTVRTLPDFGDVNIDTDYLRQFGLVALGGVWLRMAEAALRFRANGPAMTTFCNARLQTAHHYFVRLLSEAALRHDTVLCGYAQITNLVAEGF